MKKSDIVAAILEKLREGFELRQRTSKLTREGGNDAESRAEGKYDTLAIEENYLADGLARQAQAALEAAAELEKMPLRDFAADEPIDLGALVELEFPDGIEWFFVAPCAGGTEIVWKGKTVTVITPESPLGGQLAGLRAGETVGRSGATVRSVK